MKSFLSPDIKDVCKRESPFEFSRHTTIGCGGYAKIAFYPETLLQMQALHSRFLELGVKYCIVGNGSNLLPPDGELRQVVICTKRMRAIRENDGLFVEAGVTSGQLLRECIRLGKSGAEFLTGIPCTLGGALFMNAGVAGAYISQIVESVTVLREGNILELPVKVCEYSYKSSLFMRNDDVILGANLRLYPAAEEEIKSKMREYAARRTHLPRGKSMGCIFKNPENLSAGKLIEGAGLKGLRVGNAVVSEKHANFILNEGGATSQQVRTLIGIVKNAVYAQYRIKLQEEIRYLT